MHPRIREHASCFQENVRRTPLGPLYTLPLIGLLNIRLHEIMRGDTYVLDSVTWSTFAILPPMSWQRPRRFIKIVLT